MRCVYVVLVLSALLAPLAAGSMAKVPAPPVEDAVVRAGPAPCGTAAQGRSVWVGVYEAGTLLRLDARGRVTRRVRVGRFACRVAVSPGTRSG